MSAAGQATINEGKMNVFLGKVVGDFGAVGGGFLGIAADRRL